MHGQVFLGRGAGSSQCEVMHVSPLDILVELLCLLGDGVTGCCCPPLVALVVQRPSAPRGVVIFLLARGDIM